MCVPNDLAGGEGPLTSSTLWSKVVGVLASAGAGGQFAANMLANAHAGNEDWAAHAKSELAELKFASGATTIVNAADLDPALLAAYGYSYGADGLMSIYGSDDARTGAPSGSAWDLRDGKLVHRIGMVTGEVVAGSLSELEDLASSASVLINHDFDRIPLSPDERLASVYHPRPVRFLTPDGGTSSSGSRAPDGGSAADFSGSYTTDGRSVADFEADSRSAGPGVISSDNGFAHTTDGRLIGDFLVDPRDLTPELHPLPVARMEGTMV